jgi:hypothetical protein
VLIDWSRVIDRLNVIAMATGTQSYVRAGRKIIHKNRRIVQSWNLGENRCVLPGL